MMNIFEYLGLPANHRPKGKVVQLVKHWDEVPESKKQFPYYGQVKKDGVFGMIAIDGYKPTTFGRTGEQLSNCYAINEIALSFNLPRGIYIGEIRSTHPCSLEELSGVLNPNRVNELDDNQCNIRDGLIIHLHDFVSIEAFKLGNSELDYLVRYTTLYLLVADTPFCDNLLRLTRIVSESHKDAFTKRCIEAGEEGAVFKRPDLTWVAGHKGFHQMKEVSQVDYDLMCVGYEEGVGKYYGKVANLLFRWKDGETIKAMLGKGYTHEAAEGMLKEIKAGSAFSPIGKVFRVKGLCDSSKGKIRLPKVQEHRHDKSEADF